MLVHTQVRQVTVAQDIIILYDPNVHVIGNSSEELEVLQSIQRIQAVEVVDGFGSMFIIYGKKFQWLRVDG
jgi:hypothetical protein